MKRIPGIISLLGLIGIVALLAGCGGSGGNNTTAPNQPVTPTTVSVTAKLVFTTQPGGAVAWEPFKTQPVVTVVDSGGNTVTSFNDAISISLKELGGSLIAGETQVVAVNGVAKFNSIYIDGPGTFVLKARTRTGQVEDGFSEPFEVAPAAK